MRLLIVEDEVILRDSLAKSLGKERDVEAVFTLADAFDVVDVVAAKDIDIILMDVCTENDSSGLVAAQKVKEAYPDVRIVIMTGMPEVSFVKQAREVGAESFIYKNVSLSYLASVLRSTLDGYSTYPNKSQAPAEQIKEANSNGEISGDTIQTDLVANLGYGYVGFNANRVKVGDGNGGDEASKDLRKAIATVIAVYRDVAVDSYYGEFANVINYPISDTSWAAPRVTDEGYKVAFSVDVNGNDIYTEGMSADDKYAAAKQAALGYFEAAGYTVADGKITAAPAGGRMDAEVMVGGSGKGDHPSFMALTLASDALKEIGFNLIVSDMSNFAEMTNAINAGTADMFAMAWQATPDPDMFQIYHSQGGSNEKSYWIKDADLDELIMMARQSTDQTYRKTLYKQCLDIVADWAVEIPIYQRQNCVIFSAKRVNLDTVTPDITTYWTWYNDIELLDLQ